MLGDSIIMSAFSTPADTSSLTVGVASQAVCAVAGAGIGLALLGVLSRHRQALAWGYLAFRSMEGVAILAIGAYILTTTSLVAHYEILIYGFTGTAGLMLSYILHRARLVPSWLSWLGIIGYSAILLAFPSTLLDLATLYSGPGMVLCVPGRLFELLLPILLITRGFRRTGSSPSATPSPAVVAV